MKSFPIRVENIMEQMKMNLIEGGQNKAIIVDVDGTIADHYDEDGIQMREHHDYGQIIHDRPIWSIINLVKILHAEGFDILITTGRMDRPGVRQDTEAWLKQYNVPFEKLIMRKNKDFSRDDEAKEKLYEEHIKDKYEIEFVLDDRTRVVEMWRELGLKVLQVTEGDF
jgi:phosphoglycolate phosphatase-like HAD superfamily hydrolase